MYSPSDLISTLPITSTRKTYRTALSRYLEIVTNSKIKKDDLDSSWKKYIQSHPIIEEDLLHFIQIAENSYHLTPKTIHLYAQISVIYLSEAGYELSEKTLRIVRNRTSNNNPISREEELTRPLLQRILKSADLRLKTEILLAVSSGMRIGEILSIRISDVDMTSSPASIYLRSEYTKTKCPRKVYISNEAASSLKKWIDNLKSSNSDGISHQNDERLFPYSSTCEIAILRKHLKDIGLLKVDERTNRATIHFHLFRKYFLTEFKLVASSEVAEELAGHKGYLSNSYRRLSSTTIRDEYLKAEPNLTIFPTETENTNHEDYSELIDNIQKTIDKLYGDLYVLSTIIKGEYGKSILH